MKSNYTKTLIALAGAVASLTTTHAVTVLVGNPGPSSIQDCIFFGCGTIEQFVFDSSNFSGPISIDKITFFNSLNDPDTFDSASYTFKLSTTSVNSATLNSNFASNVGGDEQVFATTSFSGAVPSVISISGSPFTYNPANGNLLLEVDKPNGGNAFSAFTDYNAGFAVSRVWDLNPNSTSGNVNNNYGPVTQFDGRLPSVPDSSTTLSLIGLSLTGLSAARGWARRK